MKREAGHEDVCLCRVLPLPLLDVQIRQCVCASVSTRQCPLTGQAAAMRLNACTGPLAGAPCTAFGTPQGVALQILTKTASLQRHGEAQGPLAAAGGIESAAGQDHRHASCCARRLATSHQQVGAPATGKLRVLCVVVAIALFSRVSTLFAWCLRLPWSCVWSQRRQPSNGNRCPTRVEMR